MPIRPLLAQSAFDPETIEMLVSAFDAAWDKVEKSGSRLALPRYARGAREIVAKQIIELAQNGERNLQRLADDAVAHLTQFYE